MAIAPAQWGASGGRMVHLRQAESLYGIDNGVCELRVNKTPLQTVHRRRARLSVLTRVAALLQSLLTHPATLPSENLKKWTFHSNVLFLHSNLEMRYMKNFPNARRSGLQQRVLRSFPPQ